MRWLHMHCLLGNNLGNGDENNNNFIDNVVNNNHYNQNISEKVKSEDDSGRNKFTRKAKRGRPCAKPPTKEILRRRRKVGYFSFSC